jgi:hypothetical protein
MLVLKIGVRFTGEVETLEEASLKYQELRDQSEEGASSFPNGRVTGGYLISYNGRVWKEATERVLVMEAARAKV